MTDTTLPAPARIFPVSILLASVFIACFVAVAAMNGSMMIATIPALPHLGAVLLAAAAVLACVHLRDAGFGFGVFADFLLAVALAAMAGYGIIQITTESRGDHEISEGGYARIARTLAVRPEAVALLKAARADGIITNDEHGRFDADLRTLDRNQALGR